MEIAKVASLKKPANAQVRVPGSKSYSLRALFIRALTAKNFEIINLLESQDVSTMSSCLNGLSEGRNEHYTKESGITTRFLTALCCVTPGQQTIYGSPSLNKRPIKDLVDCLISLGAKIEYLDKDGFPPIIIKSESLKGLEVNISGRTSSQYISAILLIAPKFPNGLVINISDDQISKPYIDMTIDTMKYFGVNAENKDYKKYVVRPQNYEAKDYTVEADYSSASYFYAINKLTRSKIEIADMNPASLQADKKFVELLNKIDISKGFEVNMADCPDQAMTMAILAAFAEGVTTISGVSSLRIKETERVKAIENELAKIGIETSSTKDTLTVRGGKPSAANIDTYNDHRVAMSFAVAACKLPNLSIMRPHVVNKTFPGFWDSLSQITDVSIGKKRYSNVVLVGMRGTGKSTAGQILAKLLKKNFVDTDNFIEKNNKINIKQTVQQKGWDYFRNLESEAIAKICSQKNQVIATGGGAILSGKNVAMLREDSLVFFLFSDLELIKKRISNDKRPALTDKSTLDEELEQVWKERKYKYFSSCDFVVDANVNNQKKLVREIMDKLGRQYD